MKVTQNILITGASGLVGRHLIDNLLNEDVHIYALYNSSLPELNHKNLSWLKCDLENEFIVGINVNQINAVIHCAALTPTDVLSDETCYKANSIFDAKVFDFCNTNWDIKIVYLSSIYIENYKEEELINYSRYLYGKWQSEQQLKKMKNNWASFRISSPYGIHQTYRNVLKKFIENAIKGKDLLVYGTGNRTQDFIAANDIAEAILMFLKTNLSKCVFNICSGKPVSMKELAAIVKNSSGINIAIINANKPDDQEDYRADFDNFSTQRVLKWHPKTSLQSGITEWLKFLKQ